MEEWIEVSVSPDFQGIIMHKPEWFVAYSDWPGRYSVVSLKHPRWLYIFDHIQREGHCLLESRAFQSLALDFPSKQIYSEGFADQAYAVLQSVVSWFEPLPICNAPEFIAPIPPWLFGTSPQTFREHSTLLALRIYREAHEIAVLSFDQEGFLEDVEASNVDLAIEAEEAFQLWTGRHPTLERFMP